MTSAINDDKHLRKKSKHRKENEETLERNKKHKDKEEGDASINEPEKEMRKKEKKAKKNKGDTQNDDVVLVEEDSVTSKREKKKRKRDIDEITEDEADTMTLPKKKKKKTRKSDDHESINSKGRTKLKSAEGDQEETPETTHKKSKKSRKNKTGFVDPEQDKETDLPEQARKALSYAFRRFHDPDNWKFNKAKQNWLVRNLWNFHSIPEKYEDLVVRYLSAVQGNTRDNILKTCKDTLDPNNTSEASEVSDKSVSAGGPIIDTPTSSNNDDQRKARAQALLKALAPESAS